MIRRDLLTLRRERPQALLTIDEPPTTPPRPLTMILRRPFPPPCGAWPAWLRTGHEVTLPVSTSPAGRPEGPVLAEFRDGRGVWPAVSMAGDAVRFHFDPWATATHITEERYLTPSRPLYARLPESIRSLPGPLRLAGQHVVIPLQQWRYREPDNPFPRYPREDAVEVLRAIVQSALGRPPEQPWPWDHPVVALTHDVDTGQGQIRAPDIAAVEHELGMRSCWFVAGDRYPLDHALWDELRHEGHELGLHGARHDGRIAYLDAGRIARRLDRCADVVQRHEMVGFRSPALLMSDTLADAIRERFAYDSSVPDTDVRAVAGPRRGCASLLPVWRRGLLQLPLTLPLDDRLLLLGHTPRGVYEVWRNKLDWIIERGGVALVTTHAEPHLGADPGVLDAYRRLLEHIRGRGIEVRLPRDVARAWARVDAADAGADDGACGERGCSTFPS
jgi:peptidoglycan/xylan/chitin deacetylase (PgdA/CDA1 family)